MQSYCPDITLVGETSVSQSIQAMDCHINAAVETGYDRLFGPGGAFVYALTGLLVIYVALIGYGFLTGRTRLTMAMMSPRIVTMVLVLTFVSVWPAYHAVFYGLLMGGPDEVAAALLGERGSAVMNFAQDLDGLFVKFADIARVLDPSTAQAAAQHTTVQSGITVVNTAIQGPRPMSVTLFWLSGLCLLVSTLGVLILTRLVLYLLLILGPVFILLALFPQTRGLFNGWIRTALIFALAPMFTVLGGTAAMLLFVPLIDSIGANPQAAAAQVQPMVILFMGSLIYAAFLFVLMWVAANLVKDWQATWRDKPASERGGGMVTATLNAATQQAALTAVVARATVADRFERTEPLVTAVARDAGGGGGGGQGGATRTEVLGLYDPQSRATSGDRFSRVQGLGQRFRPGAKPAVIPTLPRPQDKPI